MIEDNFPVNSAEQLRSTDDLYREILLCEPKEVTLGVPSNAAEQKKLFLSGETRNPHHVYGKLMEVDFEQRAHRVRLIGAELVESVENPNYKIAYQSFVDSYITRLKMLEIAQQLQSTPDDIALKSDYMQINIERNGEPDREVFESMLTDKIKAIDAKNLGVEAQKIKDELNKYLADFVPTSKERFTPSAETIEWMKEAVNALFENLLRHVPGKEVFEDVEIKAVFEEIIRDEFGEAGEGWVVDIEEAQSVNVKASEKRIVIPIGKAVDAEALRSLVVHELGIHMLRSLAGAQSDLPILETGLNGYYDTEEGLGSVTEQGYAGKYREAGADHYITAGVAHHLGKDFRDTFEIKWRLSALTSYKSGTELTEEAIEKAKNAAYGSTMRSFRLTDTMPWFKDLSYYNGANATWKYIESILGDDLQLSLLFLGKATPGIPEHKRLILETHTP